MIPFRAWSGYRPILDAAKSLGVDGGAPAGCCRSGGGGGGGGGCPCFDGKVLIIETLLKLQKKKQCRARMAVTESALNGEELG